MWMVVHETETANMQGETRSPSHPFYCNKRGGCSDIHLTSNYTVFFRGTADLNNALVG